MASEEARAIIARLEASGLTRAGIGRAIGRDSGMISQIAREARGAGYGAALVPALEQLAAETATAVNVHQARGIATGLASTGRLAPARRTTKAGATAKVRRKTHRVGGHGGGLHVPGKAHAGTGHETGAVDAKLIDEARRTHQRVSYRIEIENNTGPGTRWVTISNLDADTWRYLLGLAGDTARMRERLQAAVDELAENGDLSSDVTVTGAHQLNVEAI